MTRALFSLTVCLTFVFGLAGCDLFGGGGADAGAKAAPAKKADAGAKAAAPAGIDVAAMTDRLAKGDETALEELKKGGKDVGHQLNELLKSEDPKQRRAAAFAARAFPGEQHSAALAPILDKETDKDVSKTIVETLAISGDSKAVAAIVGALNKEAVQKDALVALTKVSDKIGDQKGPARDALLKVVVEGEEKKTAVTLLGDLKDPKAIDPLAKVVKDRKAAEELRVAALQALGAIGDKSALKKAVFPAFKARKNEAVRLAAVEAAAAIGHKSAIPKLKRMARRDKSRKVKKAAKSAIKTLRKK